MGQFRFTVPQGDRLPAGAVELAYLTGLEAVPFPSRNTFSGGQLVIDRDVRESGNLHVLWRTSQLGPLQLSTASLMERDRPYLLPVELARGTLNRLRNQAAQWQAMGLSIPPAVDEQQRIALGHFTVAATQQVNVPVACAAADSALNAALEAIDLLTAAYTEQVLTLRHDQCPRLATLLGCTLPGLTFTEEGARLFQNAFNAAVAPLCWRSIEAAEGQFDWSVPDSQFQWLRGRPLKVCAGPLLRLDPASLPDWIYLWEDDFETLVGYIHHFISLAVQRYKGEVQVWHCAAGLNLPGGLSLSEEHKLRLAVLAIETIRQVDPRTPVVISFDQPWGEYLQQEEMDLPPYHFADALVRADLGLSGIGLEINLGYWPGGSLPRDVMELSRMIDRWSTLSLPLLAILSAPSAPGASPLCLGKGRSVAGQISAAETAQRLAPWLELLIAKQAIHGVLWSQFADGEPHVWPFGGLVDAQWKPKPLLAALTALRQHHLA